MNEDAGLDISERGLWAVADGMGGHDFGDVASGMLVQALACQPPCKPLAAFVLAVRERLRKVNDDLRTLAADRDVPMVGTTVVALLAVEDESAILWAGDSRAYLMRRGLLRQMTRDHRQADGAALRRAEGAASAAGAVDITTMAVSSAISLPAVTSGRGTSTTATNLISRAVGATGALLLDEICVAVEDGDIFLLCSDGLTNMVTDSEIGQALLHGSCRQAAQMLVALALQRGGTDNITVVIVSATDLNSCDRTVFNPAA